MVHTPLSEAPQERFESLCVPIGTWWEAALSYAGPLILQIRLLDAQALY